MSNPTEDLLSAFDGHETDAIRAALDDGADCVNPIRGKLPINWLLEEYSRSDRLGACIQLLIERGAKWPDPLLAPILLNDGQAIADAVRAHPAMLEHRVTLRCAFTSLNCVTLLHVAAEYGNLDAARALLDAGANVNAEAALDDQGLNGHTPLFHTVNSIHNRSEPIMRLLLKSGARTDVRLAGLHWGQGYDWETTFFDVTPISYAQMGLMPQVHRSERGIYDNIRLLLEASGRPADSIANVPNRYLRPK